MIHFLLAKRGFEEFGMIEFDDFYFFFGLIKDIEQRRCIFFYF